MRILIIAESYPPEPVVGAFRVKKLSRAFAERGHEVVTIVTRAGGVTASGLPGVELRVVTPWRSPQQLLAGIRGIGKSRAPATRSTPTGASQSFEGSSVRRLIAGLLNLPDEQQGLIFPLYLAARQAIRDQHFDLVYSTAPSFSVQVASLLLSRSSGIPWVAEYRDPWGSNGTRRAARNHSLTSAIDRRLEQACLTRPSALVAVTEAAGNQFRRQRQDGMVTVALNGIDTLVKERRPATDRDRLQIVYTGSLYPPRDPRPMLSEIARQVIEKKLPIPELIFAGDCLEYDGQPLADFTRSIGLSGHFKTFAWMPQKDVQELIAGADLLLLPAQGWAEQLPNKLFDYLGSRVPILSFADRDGESDRLLKRVGGHFVATHADEIPLTVEAALASANRRTTVGDSRLLNEITVEQQFSMLVRNVEQWFPLSTPIDVPQAIGLAGAER